MTVDKFGRHITQKQANKIYLIEDASQFRKELQQQWTEEIEKFKNLVSTHMNCNYSIKVLTGYALPNPPPVC